MIKEKNQSRNNILVLLLIYGIFFFINLNIAANFDDAAFRQSFESFDGNLISWLRFYWNNWSSRIICHGCAVLLMDIGGYAFSAANAFVQTALIYTIKSFTCHKKANENILLIIIFISYLAFIPYEVRMESDLWQIATVIYLWGITSALFCVKFFYRKIHGITSHAKWEYIAAAVAAVYASNCEQAAPVVIAFGIITEIYMKLVKKHRFTAFNWLLILLCGGGFMLCLTAPGNALRQNTEILMNVGYYPASSLLEKGFFGIITAVKLTFKYYPVLMLVLAVLAAVTVFTYNSEKFIKATAVIPVAYFSALNLFNWMKTNFPGMPVPFNLDYLLFDIIPVEAPAVSYAPNQWISTAIAVYICILTGALIFVSFKEKDNLIAGLLYGAAFAVVAVIGFTVTGRVTGARTTFTTAVLLITVCTVIAADILQKIKYNNTAESNTSASA